jgi:hypothetical protein
MSGSIAQYANTVRSRTIKHRLASERGNAVHTQFKIQDPLLDELKKLDADVASLSTEPNACAQLMTMLPKKYPGMKATEGKRGGRVWDYAGLLLQSRGRPHEALEIHWQHYLQLLGAQRGTNRVHKGTPLVRIADCYGAIGFPVHSKRYLMLTLCEDALRDNGNVSPQTTGFYFRLIWGGLPERSLRQYCGQFVRLAQNMPRAALFPEALLQRLEDDKWMTESPSINEASFYRVNPFYVRHLIENLGDGSGQILELLTQYLMSCMAGCRTRHRAISWSTDYDLICAMEGFDLDFRSELGRYFICECKDRKNGTDFSAMAKFCRVLDSIKSRFGILVSPKGVTGQGKKRDADLERMKIFQDRGIVIVVLNLEDLKRVADGMNLIALLRSQYEDVRLDLWSQATQPRKGGRLATGRRRRKVLSRSTSLTT